LLTNIVRLELKVSRLITLSLEGYTPEQTGLEYPKDVWMFVLPITHVKSGFSGDLVVRNTNKINSGHDIVIGTFRRKKLVTIV
jgi:hypothetical protein